MELKMVCGTWIKEEDEKIINELRASDTWLTVEELSERTGIAPNRVKWTLGLIRNQMNLYEARRKLLSED